MKLEMMAPFPPWSINQERTKHWSWRHTRAQQYRMLARNALNNKWLDRFDKNRQGIPSGPYPIEVTITLPIADNRRRDPHNFTPACKAIIDGLVDAGLAPDDTPAYIHTTEPILKQQPYVTIELTPLPSKP